MKILFNVGTIFCFECVMALRKFVGSVKGISAVEIDEGMVSVEYDPAVVSEEKVDRIVRDSVERLGYRIQE
jgi:copper chaperone CopZ